MEIVDCLCYLAGCWFIGVGLGHYAGLLINKCDKDNYLIPITILTILIVIFITTRLGFHYSHYYASH